MKVPISWLNEYVDVDASPQAIAERLTFSGMEVESIDEAGRCPEGVVVGEVTGIEPHPSADRLRICLVDDGAAVRRVVCGAFNFEVGDKAAYAPVGTVLGEGFQIQRRAVRGEESDGMLCAEDELGLSDDHSGILLVARSESPGTPLCAVLPAPDTVLQIEITWNRSDCLSIIGVAREVAALYGKPLMLPDVAYAESGESVNQLAEVVVEDGEACPHYTARVLTQVKWAPSPEWMQRRLLLCGVRPISNVVDVTKLCPPGVRPAAARLRL